MKYSIKNAKEYINNKFDTVDICRAIFMLAVMVQKTQADRDDVFKLCVIRSLQNLLTVTNSDDEETNKECILAGNCTELFTFFTEVLESREEH